LADSISIPWWLPSLRSSFQPLAILIGSTS
jgi:hypothetical protein